MVACDNCGAQWRDQYNLVGIACVEGPKKAVTRDK
jgi:hypothetical protein